MIVDEDRQALAMAQAKLVESLLAAGAPPAGFDPSRLALAAKSLHKKRARGVERTWLATTTALGAEFAELFALFATAHPAPASAAADGLAFAKWLLHQNRLGDAGCRELATRLAARGWPLRMVRSKDWKRFVLAVRWWRLGMRCHALRNGDSTSLNRL